MVCFLIPSYHAASSPSDAFPNWSTMKFIIVPGIGEAAISHFLGIDKATIYLVIVREYALTPLSPPLISTTAASEYISSPKIPTPLTSSHSLSPVSTLLLIPRYYFKARITIQHFCLIPICSKIWIEQTSSYFSPLVSLYPFRFDGQYSKCSIANHLRLSLQLFPPVNHFYWDVRFLPASNLHTISGADFGVASVFSSVKQHLTTFPGLSRGDFSYTSGGDSPFLIIYLRLWLRRRLSSVLHIPISSISFDHTSILPVVVLGSLPGLYQCEFPPPLNLGRPRPSSDFTAEAISGPTTLEFTSSSVKVVLLVSVFSFTVSTSLPFIALFRL